MTQVNTPVETNDPVDAVKQWFALMERYCASVDYAAAEHIFAEDVVSFGTAMSIVRERKALREGTVGEYLGKHQRLQDGPGQCSCGRKRKSGVGSSLMDIHRL